MYLKLQKIKKYLEPGMFHFVLAILLGSFGFLWRILGLPDVETLTILATSFFEEYGIVTLLIAAFLESLFVISFYFPGGFVVILAIIVSDRSIESLSIIVLIGWISVLLATAVNYWLGEKGFYRILLKLGSNSLIDRMKSWLDKRGPIVLFLTGFNPNFLAIANICMGITKRGLLKSLGFTFLGLVFWVPVIVYVFGFVLPNPQENGTFLYWLTISVLFVWGIILVLKEHFQIKKKTNFDLKSL